MENNFSSFTENIQKNDNLSFENTATLCSFTRDTSKGATKVDDFLKGAATLRTKGSSKVDNMHCNSLLPLGANRVEEEKKENEVYTLYSIITSKDNPYHHSAMYKQILKCYRKEEICYEVNQILKNKFLKIKNICKKELQYFRENEEENSLRRNELKNIMKSDFIPLTFEEIMRYHKNNNALFYSNELLFQYSQSFHDFFVTITYIE